MKIFRLISVVALALFAAVSIATMRTIEVPSMLFTAAPPPILHLTAGIALTLAFMVFAKALARHHRRRSDALFTRVARFVTSGCHARLCPD